MKKYVQNKEKYNFLKLKPYYLYIYNIKNYITDKIYR